MSNRLAEQPPRITIVLFGPGNSIHVRKWAMALSRKGHRVVVATWVRCPPIIGVDLLIPPLAGTVRGAKWTGVWHLIRAAGWLRREIGRIEPDVIHVHSVGTAGLLSIAIPARTSRIVSPWGSDLRFHSSALHRSWIVGAALRRADLVLPTSNEVSAEVVSRYRVPAARVQAVSWGVDDDLLLASDVGKSELRAQLGLPADSTILLSIRSAGSVYRTDEILVAFLRAAMLRQELHMVVILGNTPAEAAAREQQNRCLQRARDMAADLPGQITVIDQSLSNAELYRLMCASDVAVSVPRWDQRSTTVLEAALAGCRLLLSDLSPYRDLQQDGMTVDLVPDPLEINLTKAFLETRPIELLDKARNRIFIERHEMWSKQVDAVFQNYLAVMRKVLTINDKGT